MPRKVETGGQNAERGGKFGLISKTANCLRVTGFVTIARSANSLHHLQYSNNPGIDYEQAQRQMLLRGG